MWHHMARIIGEVGPHYVFVENSPLLTQRGLHRVLGDLATLGYDARWGVLGAVDAGAPHNRDRIWIRAEVADSNSLHEQRKLVGRLNSEEWTIQKKRPLGSCNNESGWWTTEPNVGRMAHGVAARVDRLRCIGNGQVPAVAAFAWEILSK